ncbi:MAG: head-tail connector protein, partial [Candidatus Obscuribacterales bacterium]|nr:head-tail connector protein [Candidatus Obscuribacterales bacterium]
MVMPEQFAQKIKTIMQRHESLKQAKQNWLPIYQQLARYVLQRKQNFTTESDSPFVLNGVFDSTAIHSALMMASSVLGQVWPNPFESFEFVPQIAQEDAVFSDAYDMMTTVNEVMPANLALAEAGVMTALHEAFNEAIVFGTGAIAVIETGDIACPVKVKALDIKSMTIAENDQGQVDTIYMEKCFTVGKLVQRYGYANVSEKVQKR